MNNCAFVVLILTIIAIIVIISVPSIKEGYSTEKPDIQINIDSDGYPNYGCAGPYCGRRSCWYNRYTPFPWNNPTRFNNWYYPSYLYFTDYYRYSSYPYYYYY